MSVGEERGRDGDTITLTREAYEDLIDARDHALAMREIASGAMETLSSADADAYLAASSPLAFWRRHRGFTQEALAKIGGVAQPSLRRNRGDGGSASACGRSWRRP